MDDSLRKDPGEQVNITCRATGNPAPAVKWVVKTGEGRHAPITQWSHENHTLWIDSVQEHHYGEYVCFAENEFGNDTVVLAVGKSNVPVGYKPNIPIGKSNIPAGTSNAVLDFQKKILGPTGPHVFIFGRQNKYSSRQKLYIIRYSSLRFRKWNTH